MAARTRPKPSSRSRRRAPVKAVGKRRSGPSFYTTLHDLLIRRESVGLALIVLALLAVPWLVPFTSGLADTRNRFVATFGLLIFAWIALLLYAGWLLIRDEQERLWEDWRPWAIGILSGLFLLGFFGFFNPAWSLGDVSLADHTAGGDLGGRIVGNPVGVLLWLALGVAAFSITWPEGAMTIARGTPSALRTAWDWRIPGRIGHAAKTAFEFVFPTHPQPQGSAKMPIDSVMWARTAGVAADVDEDQDGEPAPEPVQSTLFPELDAQDEDEDAPAVTTDDRGNRRSRDGWQLPSMDVLVDRAPADNATADNAQRASLIEETLASFGVDARVVQINEGPTVTQFGIEPGWEIKTRTLVERDKEGKPLLDKDGNQKTRVEEVSRTRVRVQQITSLANDMALALAAPSIRIEAPIPGKSVVGIEVPNPEREIVYIRDLLEAESFRASSSKLTLALGKDIFGNAVDADLARMPHLLVAGATGTGKSVFLNSLLCSILFRATPDELKLLLVDPKLLELSVYEGIPHLIADVVTNPKRAAAALAGIVHKMEERYQMMSALGVRSIDQFNARVTDELAAGNRTFRLKPRPGEAEGREVEFKRLPYIVVVIDELADLMVVSARDVEEALQRLAQMARAAGIHLVLATQRPSVDVLTGVIKANFPARISFQVSSRTDSRTILDQNGAEHLLGQGDMLFLPPGTSKLQRIHGAYVSEKEVAALVSFLRSQGAPRFDETLLRMKEESEAKEERGEEVDDMYDRAIAIVAETRNASISYLQRRLKVGYNRAARMIEQMEADGIVGPQDGTKPREVFTRPLELE